jgi:F420-non-reducing hydrogenase iron-sulfur subunit
MEKFNPKILAFLCNWCSYAGADLAGVSRIQYSPDIRVIRVMCSGRVDPIFIIKAFLEKIDGIMVLGCHFGDCHYLNGNYNAEKRIIATRKLLSFSRVEQQRLYLDWVSAAEGERFAALVNDFIKQIKEMGPIAKLNTTDDTLLAVKDVLSGEAFRHMTGIEWKVTEKENVYGEKIAKNEFEKIMDGILYQEFIRCRIVRLLHGRILSIPEISSALALTPHLVFNEICVLQEKSIVSLVDIKSEYPRYAFSK